MAKLYFFYGCMGSAKTANALMTAFNFTEKGQNVVLMKPKIDTRSEEMESRIGLKSKCILIEEHKQIAEYLDTDKLDWIIVDEAQFLTVKQVNELANIVDEEKINVICYGLKTNFKSELFPASKRLIELADKLKEIKTMCSCGSKAIINARLKNGKIIKEGPEVLIGGNETYTSLCRKCWNKKSK